MFEGAPPHWEKLSLSGFGGRYPLYLSPDTPENPASRRQGPGCPRENPGDGNKGEQTEMCDMTVPARNESPKIMLKNR